MNLSWVMISSSSSWIQGDAGYLSLSSLPTRCLPVPPIKAYLSAPSPAPSPGHQGSGTVSLLSPLSLAYIIDNEEDVSGYGTAAIQMIRSSS